MLNNDPAIEARDLVVGYGSAPVVRGVSLCAQAGKMTAVVGPNGAGKSTFIKAVARHLEVQAGSIFLRGQSILEVPSYRLARMGLGYLPQQFPVFPSLTVAENLDIGAYSRRRRRSERLSFVCDLFPPLQALLHRSAWTLSGGEQRMLAIGRALMADPAVLLLDEPTAGLSPMNRETMWHHLEEIRSRGVTVLVIEQNTREALSRADFAYVLTLGEVRLFGPARDVLESPELASLYFDARTSAAPKAAVGFPAVLQRVAQPDGEETKP